jgi:hypothetical protein
LHRPDRIVVTYLDHKAARKKDFFAYEAERIAWMAEFSALSRLATRREANRVRQEQITIFGSINEGSQLTALERRLLREEQFLPIVPNVSLGNFFTGTLNFGAGNARRLLKLGYKDTLLWIEALAQHGDQEAVDEDLA